MQEIIDILWGVTQLLFLLASTTLLVFCFIFMLIAIRDLILENF